MKAARSDAPAPSANPSWRIGIVHSSFYKEDVAKLVEGAQEILLAAGIKQGNILDCPVAGSFEIPLIGSVLAREKKVDALIGLGIIVEGETHHADLLAKTATQGIMDVQVHQGVPFAFEILFVKDLAQARERTDKGEEAARAVLHSLALMTKLQS